MPTDYENAIEEYKAADQEYRDLEGFVSSGAFIKDLLVKAAQGLDSSQEWRLIWTKLRELLEDRNAKLKRAKDLLRQAVQLAPSQHRGIDGATSLLAAGDFKASSVTWRWWNAQKLLDLVEAKSAEKANELWALSKINKEGQSVPVIEENYKIDFEVVLNWLKANNYYDIINEAYEESEKTPSVKGPKVVAFLGEKKDE